MKDASSHSKLVRNKRKHGPSESTESSETENETVPVVKYGEDVSNGSNTDDPSDKDIKRLKKRKHHHHHHRHHRRKQKLKDGERTRHDDERERMDDRLFRQSHSQASSHRRHGESRLRMKAEESLQYSGSSRHRQHGDDSADRIRHHRKRGESRQRRDEPSREKRPSAERDERDQMNPQRERRGDARNFRDRGPRNGEQIPVPLNRPIKQERVSAERDFQWGKETNSTEPTNGPPVDKAKPNFALSGKLAEETNTFNGVVLKYNEPQEARKPKRRWRFYPFKGDTGLPTLYLHRQSCYLIGRDRKVADIPVDHPSCSKQHAALQYRLVPYQRDDGSTGRRVRPYIIDLDSANGTYVNNNKVEPRKYIELLEKDVVKFGYSSREYVLLHEQSKDEAMDDDNIEANVE